MLDANIPATPKACLTQMIQRRIEITDREDIVFTVAYTLHPREVLSPN